MTHGVDRFAHAALIAEDSREPLLPVAAAETAIEVVDLYQPGGVTLLAIPSLAYHYQICPYPHCADVTALGRDCRAV